MRLSTWPGIIHVRRDFRLVSLVVPATGSCIMNRLAIHRGTLQRSKTRLFRRKHHPLPIAHLSVRVGNTGHGLSALFVTTQRLRRIIRRSVHVYIRVDDFVSNRARMVLLVHERCCAHGFTVRRICTVLMWTRIGRCLRFRVRMFFHSFNRNRVDRSGAGRRSSPG